MALDARYSPGDAEPRWQRFWEERGVFRFDSRDTRRPIYSVDTPPPTVSGSIHVGHVFSYVQAEALTRFWRQQGYNVFYPFGFDDNGLPTERFVEKRRGVRGRDMARAEFVRLCLEVTREVEQEFKNLWQRLGFSVDWSLQYSTIDERSRRISQRSFLDLLDKDLVYRKETPALWCPECRTAVAQAEQEDVEDETPFTDIAFPLEGGGELVIATTRPELTPSCVAVFVHPEDAKHHSRVGRLARVPLFDYPVPVLANEDVDRQKGTGVVMCCTFGDTKDIEWWERFGLPLRIAIDRSGRMNELAGPYQGQAIVDARRSILDDLERRGLTRGQRRILHTLNTHERCGTPIEFLPAKQWFIKVLEYRDRLLECGERVEWYPASMKVRYRHWVEHLRWDWCVSRQRFFGVPIPVWICAACGAALAARREDLPVDPHVTPPPGPCRACGFARLEPEPDVLDTWATSSVTPQINARWGEPDGDLSDRLLPMSMRPQSHDIIRTWAFYTIVKSLHHHGTIPWRQIVISGHVTDSERQKLSKSKLDHGPRTSLAEVFGAPEKLIARSSADAVRYWACRGNLGVDTAYDEKVIRQGQRLITKLWNASRLALGHLGDLPRGAPAEAPIDRGLLAKLDAVERRATAELRRYEIGAALREIESFFWGTFCDNYLEMVKARLYEPARYGAAARHSAQAALRRALVDILRLLAPFLPHVTEEIYQGGLRGEGDAPSIHLAGWPEPELRGDDECERAFDAAVDLIAAVRKFKSERSLSMGAPLKRLSLRAEPPRSTWLAGALPELHSSLRVETIRLEGAPGDPTARTEDGVPVWIEA
jgi:valyl-tRNA synthetase